MHLVESNAGTDDVSASAEAFPQCYVTNALNIERSARAELAITEAAREPEPDRGLPQSGADFGSAPDGAAKRSLQRRACRAQ